MLALAALIIVNEPVLPSVVVACGFGAWSQLRICFLCLCMMGDDVQKIAMECSLQSFVLVCFYTEETRGGEPSKGH